MKHTLTNSILIQHAPDCSRATGFDLNAKTMFKMVLGQLRLFYQYHRQRQALLKLTDEQLNDIGLTVEQARQEGKKAFWQH